MKCEICSCEIESTDEQGVKVVSEEDEWPERYVCSDLCYDVYADYEEAEKQFRQEEE